MSAISAPVPTKILFALALSADICSSPYAKPKSVDKLSLLKDLIIILLLTIKQHLLQAVSNFYQRWENLGLKITFVLVSLQVIHLTWLVCFVIGVHLPLPDIVFAAIDYLEIPALVSGIVFYSLSLIHYRKKKDILFISLLLIQFAHILWITDTFVYMAFNFNQYAWLAAIAIGIDFLELPVIYDLYKRIKNR